MDSQCRLESPDYTDQRHKLIDNWINEIKELIEMAENSKDWNKLNHTQKEIVISQKIKNKNGKTIIDIINSLNENNNKSQLELEKLNNEVNNQNNQIKANTVTLQQQNEKINSHKNNELVTKHKLDISMDRNKNTNTWYNIMLGFLIILLVLEIVIIILVLKRN